MEMRLTTGESEFTHRRLQVPPSPLHDPTSDQLPPARRGADTACLRSLTKDIRESVDPKPSFRQARLAQAVEEEIEMGGVAEQHQSPH